MSCGNEDHEISEFSIETNWKKIKGIGNLMRVWIRLNVITIKEELLTPNG